MPASRSPQPRPSGPAARSSSEWGASTLRQPGPSIYLKLSERGGNSANHLLEEGGPGFGELSASPNGLVGAGTARLAIAGAGSPDYATCSDVVGAGYGHQRLPYASLDQDLWVCFYSNGQYSRLRIRQPPDRGNPWLRLVGQLWR